MTYTDEQIASIVHAANCAVQRIDGDEAPALPWECEDQDIRELLIANVALARTGLASPQMLHEAWCNGKRAQGWTYGPVKDRDAKTHPCLVPWSELPEKHRDKDRLLWHISRALDVPQRMRAVS